MHSASPLISRSPSLALAIAMLAVSPSAYTHHSTSIYDTTQTVTVEGEVSRVAWSNPHVYIYVQETAVSGETVEWEIEAYPPAPMRRIGWDASTLKRGSSIAVMGNPTRSMRKRGIFPITIEVDGRTLFRQENMIRRC